MFSIGRCVMFVSQSAVNAEYTASYSFFVECNGLGQKYSLLVLIGARVPVSHKVLITCNWLVFASTLGVLWEYFA